MADEKNKNIPQKNSVIQINAHAPVKFAGAFAVVWKANALGVTAVVYCYATDGKSSAVARKVDLRHGQYDIIGQAVWSSIPDEETQYVLARPLEDSGIVVG